MLQKIVGNHCFICPRGIQMTTKHKIFKNCWKRLKLYAFLNLFSPKVPEIIQLCHPCLKIDWPGPWDHQGGEKLSVHSEFCSPWRPGRYHTLPPQPASLSGAASLPSVCSCHLQAWVVRDTGIAQWQVNYSPS